ncbi:Hypothetical protein P9215_01061 [Prochlorococcus marinus str. MIT 9215]|uniref:Uncharacterized protein n=1 Tax=Prochlorococcus marinus (strain MIT 9215) TaxID=93060 RepID=A8G294_PROM2|nr:Hypothetical protein P9215_01061 [Prochlorococcus marinus str. MIT 9215]
MKDFFEYKLISLIFGLLNDWDNIFEEVVIPRVINEEISNSFRMWLFNFNFVKFFERFNTLYIV